MSTTGTYADYYQRINLMAKDKKWPQERITEMLKDRTRGEREYENVSKLKSINQKSQWFKCKTFKKDEAPAPVVQRLMHDANNERPKKEILHKQTLIEQEAEAKKLATIVEEKVKQTGKPRTAEEFVED